MKYNARALKFLSWVYIALGAVYLLLFFWFGVPFLLRFQISTLGPWEPYGAAYLLFYGFSFLLAVASFFCFMTAYGFLHSWNWARKLGIVISLPPAIGTLAGLLFVLEITSSWTYYEEIGINPSLTVRFWMLAVIIGIINSALVHFLIGDEKQSVPNEIVPHV